MYVGERKIIAIILFISTFPLSYIAIPLEKKMGRKYTVSIFPELINRNILVP